MGEGDGLMRIFWPLDTSRSSCPGVIVGWRNSESDFFVLGILENVDSRSVENALRVGTLYRNSHYAISRIFELCGRTSIHVLGWSNPPVVPAALDLTHFCAYTSTSRQPRIVCAKSKDVTVQVITFERPVPSRMQYMSIDPISLILEDQIDKQMRAVREVDSVDAEEIQEKLRRAKLVQKLRLHTVTKHQPSQKELMLPLLLNQVNCSHELGRLLLANIGLVGTRSKRALSVGERVVESASTIWGHIMMSLWNLITVWLYPLARRIFIVGLTCHRIVAELVLLVLEWRLRPEYAALKDVSATAQQVDIRLQQFCYWPFQYHTLRKRKDDWESVTKSHPDYIRFYNSLWLVANDVIIGIAVGSYIIDNAGWTAYQINAVLSSYTVEGLQGMIAWLMDWPAGLKLNGDLAKFLGDLFLWVIDYWAGELLFLPAIVYPFQTDADTGCVVSLKPVLPHVIYFIGFSSFAGATMPIALFSDLISILTLHIYCFYVASARIFNWQLTIIISLFHLFRGKKRNVLRRRIDSCDYDLDQLLLGTILFTLLFFLLPTVVVFYLTFASARMVIISLKAVLDTMSSCLNHFPLFALMLRIKDSRRLPGKHLFNVLASISPVYIRAKESGIQFELQDSTVAASPPLTTLPLQSHQMPPPPSPTGTPPTSYIHLKSVPLSFRAMMQQYFQFGHRIRKHYLSPRVILCLATGRFVPPIHRKNLYSLQYSMLPASRAGILETYRLLTEKTPTVGAAAAVANKSRRMRG
ncbi:MAG: hypothetical protein M1825_000083 [Sarcosagium campestre]|nr:MAG: hypothetical protein M1825_000083 [Sarcosagium campestre]